MRYFRRWITYHHAQVFALGVGFFMIMLDITAVSVTLPTLEAYLRDAIIGLQWVMDSYSFSFACILLTAGRIVDQFHAKPIFLIGIVVFLAASLGAGLAFSLESLVLFRFTQGIGAALMLPASLALISGIYPNQKRRAFVIGIWSSFAGIGALFGPLLGAYISTTLGWRGVFFINIPFGLTAFVICLKGIKLTRTTGKKLEMDVLGQLLSMASIGLLVVGIIETGKGALSSKNAIIFGLFLFAAVLFVRIEKRVKRPMIPLALFESPRFSVIMLIGVVINITFFGQLFQLALYFKTQHLSPLLTGLAVVSHTGLSPIASYFAGKIASKRGTLIPLLMGLALGTLAFFLLFLLVNQPYSSYLRLMPSIALIGFCCMFTITAATIMLTDVVSTAKIGIASAVFFTGRQMGSLIGVAVFGSVIANSANVLCGMKYNLLLGGVLFFITGLISVTYLFKN